MLLQKDEEHDEQMIDGNIEEVLPENPYIINRDEEQDHFNSYNEELDNSTIEDLPENEVSF